MSHVHVVPTIHQDLRQEEAILQIAHALDCLKATADDVFSRIESRILESKSKLDDFKRRGNILKAKVDQLTGSNKATKVFSSAKYPLATGYASYVSVFPENCPQGDAHMSSRVTSKHLPLESRAVQEKLQFYHVKLRYKVHHTNHEIAPEEGLGCLPWDLNSVNSLLLFNTSENPYQRYVQLDPLGALCRTRHTLLDEQTAPEAPPISISQREQPERPIDSYFYSPGLGDVPLIDVPLDLPDLPGVADDLRYNVDGGPVIAPSVSTTPAFPELPVVTESPSPSGVSPRDLSLPMAPERARAPEADLPVVPPPHVPLPPAPPSPLSPPPVPQPPPPPTASSTSLPAAAVPTKQSVPTFQPVAAPAIDARASLMEAIRQAGGSDKAKLRSAKDIKIEAKKKKQEQQVSSSDFMADLHTKLAMRRKGISGANKGDGSVGRAMQRVSAMIPPPLSETGSAHEDDGAEEEEDWE